MNAGGTIHVTGGFPQSRLHDPEQCKVPKYHFAGLKIPINVVLNITVIKISVFLVHCGSMKMQRCVFRVFWTGISHQVVDSTGKTWSKFVTVHSNI